MNFRRFLNSISIYSTIYSYCFEIALDIQSAVNHSMFFFFLMHKMGFLIQEWLLLNKTCSYLIIKDIQKGEDRLQLYTKPSISHSLIFWQLNFQLFIQHCVHLFQKARRLHELYCSLFSPFYPQRSKHLSTCEK